MNPLPASPPVSRARTTAPAGPLPPLQDRTPDQLKDGMVVKVSGAGSNDLAAARLIQDGAQFMARSANTTMGLADVGINDKSIDDRGALGMATFFGNRGWFGLSQRSTQGIMEGIKRLREQPFEQWTEAQRQAFVQGNETILHEAAHVTLQGYDDANVSAWRGANRSFEEGLTEIATMTHIGDFMKEEFGVTMPELTGRITQSTSAYTRFSERIQRMLEMGTDGSAEALKRHASNVSDGVRADRRLRTIAEGVSANLGGPGAPAQLTSEIEKTLEGFVEERNGTRTKLMELQAALADHKAGKPIDRQALAASLRALDAADKRPLAPPDPVGTKPIACG